MASPSHSDGGPDLTLRYQLEVSFPEPDEEEEWDTIHSFATPREALRGCSECYETVKHLLGDKFGRDLEPGYVRIRIRDAHEDRLILWEEESGAIAAAAGEFLPEDEAPGTR